jgi:hypothetical protein
MGAIFPMALLSVRRGFVRKRGKEARRAAAQAQWESLIRNTEPTLRDYTKDQGRDDTPNGAGGVS